MRRKGHVVVCIALHVFFILLHVVLITIALLLINPPLFATSSRILEPIWTVSVQSFTIIYCAGLVTTTQRLAMQDVFHRQQTLSAIHDKSSAWLGLGSSAFALLRQRSLPTDRVGVVATLLYLLSICIVHTAFPSMFTIVGFEGPSTPIYRPTVLAYQNFGDVSQMGYDVYNFLDEYNSLDDPPAGLANNAIYDIFPADVAGNSSMGTLTPVNMTLFSVNCTYVSDVTLQNNNSASPRELGSLGEPTDIPFTINLDTNLMAENVTLFPMRPHTLQMVPYSGLPGTVMLASTYSVVDTDGKRPPFINIEPPWNIQGNSSDATDITSAVQSIQVQLMACEIGVKNESTIGLGVSSQLLQTPDAGLQSRLGVTASPSNATVWHEWTPAEYQPGPPDPMIDYIQKLISHCPPIQNFSDTTVSTHTGDIELGDSGIIASPYVPSMLENFVWADIVHTRSVEMPSCPCINNLPFSVAELNFSLERAFAALIWSLNNQTADDSDKQHGLVELNLSISPVDIYNRERAYIALNPILIGISLVASCGAFITCIMLIHRSQGFRTEVEVPFVDTSGVLPVVWLLGSEPRLADIEEPDIDALRKAGMFEFDSDVFRRFNSSVKHRTRGVKGYEGVESNDHDSE